MNSRELRWLFAVMLSLGLALLLTGLPLPDVINPWRPAWVPLTLFYWCIALPERVGVLGAWVVGILLDVMHGSLLGQHALGLAFVAFVAVRYHQRIRVYPPIQQAMVVGFLVLLYEAWMLVIYNTMGSRLYSLMFLFSALTSAVLWPWLFVVLRDLRRKAMT